VTSDLRHPPFRSSVCSRPPARPFGQPTAGYLPSSSLARLSGLASRELSHSIRFAPLGSAFSVSRAMVRERTVRSRHAPGESADRNTISMACCENEPRPGSLMRRLMVGGSNPSECATQREALSSTVGRRISDSDIFGTEIRVKVPPFLGCRFIQRFLRSPSTTSIASLSKPKIGPTKCHPKPLAW
jgi:hypothetical protein